MVSSGTVFVGITSLASTAFLIRSQMIDEQSHGDTLMIALILSAITTVMAITWSLFYSQKSSAEGKVKDIMSCSGPLFGVATPLALTITFVLLSYLNDTMGTTLITLAFIGHIATMIVLKFGYDVVTFEKVSTEDGGYMALLPYPLFLYALNEVTHNITNNTSDIRSSVFVYVMTTLLGGMEVRKFFTIFIPKGYTEVDTDTNGGYA